MRVRAGLLMLFALASPAAAQDAPAAVEPTPKPQIIVRPPPTEAERHEQLRDFTREVVRPPKLRQPIAKFAFPICVDVRGLAPEDAAVIADRIRENAEALGAGADRASDCVPTVRVAFMAPAAGPASAWLTPESPQLAHLASYQRERVLAESGPVRAWSKIAVRDPEGQPLNYADPRALLSGGQSLPPLLDPLSATDPIITTEITGAAVLFGREAAHGFTLGQLADYATMRALLDTGAPDGAAPAPTILKLFTSLDPPAGLTEFDRALVRELYDASRNAKPRRVYNDIARAVVAAERSDEGRN